MALFTDGSTEIRSYLPIYCYTIGAAAGNTGFRLYGLRLRESRQYYTTLDYTATSSPIGGFDVTDKLLAGPYAAGKSWNAYTLAVRPDCRDDDFVIAILTPHDDVDPAVGRALVTRGINTETDNLIPVLGYDDDDAADDPGSFDLLCLGIRCYLCEDQSDRLNAALLNRAVRASDDSLVGATQYYPSLWACQVGSSGTGSNYYGMDLTDISRQVNPGEYLVTLGNPQAGDKWPVPLVTIEHTDAANTAHYIWVHAVTEAAGDVTYEIHTGDDTTTLINSRFHFMAFGFTATNAFATETCNDTVLNRLVVAGNGGTSNVMISAAVVGGTTGGGAAAFDANYEQFGFSSVSGPNALGAGYFELTLSLVSPAARYSFQPLYMATAIWDQDHAVTCVVDTTAANTDNTKVRVYCHDCQTDAAVDSASFRLAVVAIGVRT